MFEEYGVGPLPSMYNNTPLGQPLNTNVDTSGLAPVEVLSPEASSFNPASLIGPGLGLISALLQNNDYSYSQYVTQPNQVVEQAKQRSQNIGSGIGATVGTIIGGPIGGALLGGAGSLIGGLLGGNKQERIAKAVRKNENQRRSAYEELMEDKRDVFTKTYLGY